MMNRTLYAVLLAALAVAALSTTGCEDSDVTAPTDGIINLVVSPSNLVLDPDSGVDSASAQVIASVFSNDGQPLQNVAVLFSTGGGTLASSGSPVRTNANGIAIDTLTVVESDPDAFQVTAQSSAIIVDADVTKEIAAANEQPLASILEVPAGSAEVGQLVTFDGSSSLDPDGVITCYQWVVDSSVDANDEIVQGVSVSAIQRQYAAEQDLTVLLRVSDRTEAIALCGDTAPPVPLELFSPRIDTIQYSIVCANTPPVADAGPDQTVSALPGATSQVLLDGRGSIDPDGNIDAYVWNCGNGLPPTTIGLPPGQAFCAYRAFATTSYVATLTVRDDGTGVIGGGGTFECQKSDTDTATVNLTITSP